MGAVARWDDAQERARRSRRPDPSAAERDDAPGPGEPGFSPRQVPGWQQAAGNQAVAAVLARGRPTVERSPTVQRHAWVAGTQVDPAANGLDPAMKAFASDSTVRAYLNQAEFAAHAAGTTDHLGNLPGPNSPGTWVRFSPTGTNLLGENHTQVTLEDVVRAVGTTNFIYEPFSVDEMDDGSSMKAAYEEESKDRFARMGVAGVADKKQFGAESLYPKMGFGLTRILPILKSGSVRRLKPGGYLGQPAQRYLKIAWGHTKDVPGEVVALTTANKPVPPELATLAQVHQSVGAQLDPFISALVVDAYLGDALETPDGQKILPDLITFCEAFVAAMLTRAGTDAGLTPDEQTGLTAMKAGTKDEKEAVFEKWRNLHFSHAVRNAAGRGVRYAGMGRNHLTYLVTEGIPANSHAFDIAGRDLQGFELLTKNLAAKANSTSPP